MNYNQLTIIWPFYEIIKQDCQFLFISILSYKYHINISVWQLYTKHVLRWPSSQDKNLIPSQLYEGSRWLSFPSPTSQKSCWRSLPSIEWVPHTNPHNERLREAKRNKNTLYRSNRRSLLSYHKFRLSLLQTYSEYYLAQKGDIIDFFVDQISNDMIHGKLGVAEIIIPRQKISGLIYNESDNIYETEEEIGV